MSAQPLTPQLRPLGVGEILDVGIKIYTRNWLTLWKVVVFVVLPTQILVNVIQASAAPRNLPTTPSFSPPTRPVVISHHELVVFATGAGVAILIGLIGGQLAQGACLRTVADAYLGDPVSWRSSLRYALRRLPALVVLSLLTTLIVAIGFVFCILPGIYFWVSFYVVVPVMLIEGAGPFASLGRSRRLVQGRWWGTAGVGLVGALLVGIVSGMLSSVLLLLVLSGTPRNSVTGIVLSTLGSTVGSMLTTPAAAAFATVLYIDLRVRKEGFDLLLLARGIGSETRSPGPDPAYLPPSLPVRAPGQQAPPPSQQSPYWPPPPGWTPPDTGSETQPPPPPPAAPPAAQPPYWPPPPGWKPGE